MKAYIGKFYKEKDLAEKELKRTEKLWGKDKYAIIQFTKGFLIISRKQLGN